MGNGKIALEDGKMPDEGTVEKMEGTGAPGSEAGGGNKQAAAGPKAKNMDHKKIIEAALFMSAHSVASSDLAKLVGIAAVGFVEGKLKELAADYDSAGSSLEIAREENGKWSMRVRAKYAPYVRTFAGEAEISRHALKTLAYVSRNEGITKKELADRLGSTIYSDIAELLEKGFVKAKPKGRTKSISTTGKFKRYFEG